MWRVTYMADVVPRVHTLGIGDAWVLLIRCVHCLHTSADGKDLAEDWKK